MSSPRRVGIVGFGHLGQHLYESLLCKDEYEVAFVWNRNSRALQGKVRHDVILDSLEDFRDRAADLIVEVSHPDITRDFGSDFVKASDYLIGSPTALANDQVRSDLLDSAGDHGVYVPVGALWGGDDIRKMDSAGQLYCAHDEDSESQSPDPSLTESRVWRRQRMTSDTVQELESEYLRRPKPDRRQIEEIADRLGQKEINVYAWFYRRRMKEAKDGGRPLEDDARCKEVLKWGKKRRSKAAACFEKDEQGVLENIFTRQNNPGPCEIAGLARWFHKDEKKISTWFARRRLKLKKDFVNNLEDNYCAPKQVSTGLSNESSSGLSTCDPASPNLSLPSPPSLVSQESSPLSADSTSPRYSFTNPSSFEPKSPNYSVTGFSNLNPIATSYSVASSSASVPIVSKYIVKSPSSPNAIPLNLKFSQVPIVEKSSVNDQIIKPSPSGEETCPSVKHNRPSLSLYPSPLESNASMPSPTRLDSVPDVAPVYPIRPNVIRFVSSTSIPPRPVKMEPSDTAVRCALPTSDKLPNAGRDLDAVTTQHQTSSDVRKHGDIGEPPRLVPIDWLYKYQMMVPPPPHHSYMWNVYNHHPSYPYPPFVQHPVYGLVPNIYFGTHAHVSRTYAPVGSFATGYHERRPNECVQEAKCKIP